MLLQLQLAQLVVQQHVSHVSAAVMDHIFWTDDGEEDPEQEEEPQDQDEGKQLLYQH